MVAYDQGLAGCLRFGHDPERRRSCERPPPGSHPQWRTAAAGQLTTRIPQQNILLRQGILLQRGRPYTEATMSIIPQLVVNSLIAAGTYALIAMGFSLIYGATKFFNL